MNYDYLLYLALILLCTKLLGMLTRRAHMPQVVGSLLAGLILGPAMLNLIHDTEFLNQVAEIGVIVLMFMAGVETDTKELKRSGKSAFTVALIGVMVPLLGGYLVAYFYKVADSSLSADVFLQNIFIGIILTATSVSISVETLKELGKVSTKAGTAILGAALIDDVLGIIGLTIISSMADSTTKVTVVLLKIVGFFIFAVVAGLLYSKVLGRWTAAYPKPNRRFVVLAFVFCLIMAFCAEEFFGVADITGAYVAGLVTSNNRKREAIYQNCDTVSYMLVAPVFFASIGLKVVLDTMTSNLLIFTIVLLIVAILTKIVGCAFGAKLCHYTSAESLQIGVGMVSRGEVALIVVNKGESLGLISNNLYAPIVVIVVVTTIITPILLKFVFKEGKHSQKQLA
ncbi:cation:proton antiporter [Lachnospiraceae bacterium ZAX-1]